MYTDSYLADKYHIVQNFDGGKFWRFWHFQARPSKFNLSNCFKKYSLYRCMVKDSNHPSKYFPSNIWRVTIHQNSPRQNFALYSSLNHCLCINITQESELREATWRERLFDLIKIEDPLLPKIPPKFKIGHYLTAPFRLENKDK